MSKFTETGLETLTQGCQNWTKIMETNSRILNDTLLYVDGLLDADISSLSDRDVLVWNATSGKWENRPYHTVIPTTTTTTSSSTTTTTTV
jgi:hypothetical protein